MKPTRKTRFISLLKITGMIVMLFLIAAVIIFAIWRAGFVSWTGFGDFITPTGEFIRGKTVWDWMELLVIPLTLLIGGYILNRSERANEREVANKRAELEREISEDRQQEAALQNYFDRMTDLLLKEKRQVTEVKIVGDVVRTRTLSVMRRLDAKRNNMVVQFLRDLDLITDANSIFVNADMEQFKLSGVGLMNTNLISASLKNANLESAYLWETHLRKANLVGANLRGAYLMGTKLQGAILFNADLRGANLQGADLTNAVLSDANLDGANLLSAKITDEQLEKTKSLKDAIMPDGTKHE